MLSSQTAFSDVCGTVDEFKRRLHEDYESVASNPTDTLNPLLSDAEFMIGRMQERVDAYQAFKDSLREILSQLDDIDEVESGMGVEESLLESLQRRIHLFDDTAHPKSVM